MESKFLLMREKILLKLLINLILQSKVFFQVNHNQKSKKKKNDAGMSPWGCLGRTVVFTLILFAAYVFFGLLLEALQ